MTITLLADIGGTKTQLALVDESANLSQPQYAINKDYARFETLLEEYLPGKPQPDNAVIAVAGPVEHNRRCQMTNLPWLIDGDSLTHQFQLKNVVVMNDLQATAWGLTDSREQNRLRMLKGTQLDFDFPVVVISPGTGLGQACIYPNQNSYMIAATEGGHKTLAPFDPLSAQLVAQQWQKHSKPVSWENWFSGSGIGNLFRAMYPDQAAPPNEQIGKLAMQDPDSDCGRLMELFAKAIYAEAGNLVLQYLAWGGVIIAGGIPPKVESFFSNPQNINYLCRKNEYLDRLQAVPIALCLEQNIPIRGAAAYSQQLLLKN